MENQLTALSVLYEPLTFSHSHQTSSNWLRWKNRLSSAENLNLDWRLMDLFLYVGIVQSSGQIFHASQPTSGKGQLDQNCHHDMTLNKRNVGRTRMKLCPKWRPQRTLFIGPTNNNNGSSLQTWPFFVRIWRGDPLKSRRAPECWLSLDLSYSVINPNFLNTTYSLFTCSCCRRNSFKQGGMRRWNVGCCIPWELGFCAIVDAWVFSLYAACLDQCNEK